MVRRVVLLAALLAPGLAGPVAAQVHPGPIPEADRIRLAEVHRLARTVGDKVWPGWHRAPFPVLLITDSVEYLIWHPHPSADFTSLGRDPLLGTTVWARPRIFPTRLLATAPFVGGIPTIAVGRAEAVGKNSVEWVLTLMHEHFHQLQYSRPGYYAAVAALDLAHGDSTGMWMLNFPFPYDSAPVPSAVVRLASKLGAAVDAPTGDLDSDAAFRPALAGYRAARQELRAMLPSEDDRYLEFQLWQEGVARYTEYAVAVAASKGRLPSAAFRALPDYVDYAAAAAGQLKRLHAELADETPATNRRVIVYSLGAATALVLDRASPGWKKRYFREPLALEPFFTIR